jgi:hypothetical protein
MRWRVGDGRGAHISRRAGLAARLGRWPVSWAWLGRWVGICSGPVSKPTKYWAVLGLAQRAEMSSPALSLGRAEPGPGITRVVSC